MTLTDNIASVSRRLAQTKFRRLSAAFFRYYPVKHGVTTIRDFDEDLAIDLDRASYISSAIYWGGHHSLPTVQFLRSFLQPDMTFADIGANIGEITLVAAKRLTSGKVLAFEPMPAVFALLSHNVAINNFGCVTLHNVGLYDRDASLPLYVKRDNPHGTTNHGVTSLFSTGTDRQERSVPLLRFDEIAEASGLERLDIIKIDVEGAEMMVLRGAEVSIRRFRPVMIVEISEANFQRAGYSVPEFFQYLHSIGYDARPVQTGGRLSAECDALCIPR
jgi:FkbM family methyltransferase